MLYLRTFLVKERVAMFKLVDTYDIYDPATGEKIAEAHEEVPGWSKFARFFINKQLLPTSVSIYPEGEEFALLTIRRGVALFRPKVTVQNADGELVGYFKSKMFSLGGGFYVFNPDDSQLADVKGDWKGWNFKFHTDDGRLMGTVTKKWAGLGKELFTSADNYVIAVEDPEAGDDASALLLAAGLAIDTVYKEGR
jgi:uncharacterized protein YxjI